MRGFSLRLGGAGRGDVVRGEGVEEDVEVAEMEEVEVEGVQFVVKG